MVCTRCCHPPCTPPRQAPSHPPISRPPYTLHAGPRLALLQLDNCLYLLSRDALQSRLQQLSGCDSNPAYIAVSNQDGSPCLAMASERDVKVRIPHYSNWFSPCLCPMLISLLAHYQTLLLPALCSASQKACFKCGAVMDGLHISVVQN